MVNKVLFTALLFVFCHIGCLNGQDIRVTGRVIDDTGQSLPNCTVMLFHKQDSSFVSGVISDIDGDFSIQAKMPGLYLLEVSMLGFDKKVSFLVLEAEDIQMGNILLDESAVHLSAVTITAPKNTIEFSPGKTIVNISNSLFGSQGNILDVLKSMPGVFIREDGTVSLNGQSGTKIYLNGKVIYLSGDNLVNLLRSMSATSINKVELITHPSAKYDAAGNSGIINLQTNKNYLNGTTLSLHSRYTQGKYASGDTGFNFAYRNNKINIFSDYSFYTGKGYNDLKVKRTDLDIETKQSLNRFLFQDTYRKWNYNSHYYRIGIDYDISEKVFLGLYSNGFLMDRNQNGKMNSLIVKQTEIPDSRLFTQNKNKKNSRSFSGGISMTYKPNDNTEWNNYFDYHYHGQPESQFQHNKLEDFIIMQPSQDTLKGNMEGNIHIYGAESNITFPLGKSKISAGLKTSFISVDNSAIYFDLLNGQWINNSVLSRQFSYDENINAGYIQAETRFSESFSMQAGIRVENTNIKGIVHQETEPTDFTYSNHYTHLFPSLNLEYKLSNENTFSLLYARRITRPNYMDMNPFIYIFDNYLYEQGNPELKPSLSDNIEASFVLKDKFKTSLYLLKRNNPIYKTFHLVENEDRILVYPDNLSSVYTYGLSMNTTIFKPASWLQLNASISLNYGKYKWKFDDKTEKESVFSPFLSLSNQFELNKDWLAEFNMTYKGNTSDGQYSFKPVFMAYASIRKYILQRKGSITFTIDDAFQSGLVKGKVFMPGKYYESRERELGRLFHISFSYRFKQGEGARKSNKKRGMDESGRI